MKKLMLRKHFHSGMLGDEFGMRCGCTEFFGSLPAQSPFPETEVGVDEERILGFVTKLLPESGQVIAVGFLVERQYSCTPR